MKNFSSKYLWISMVAVAFIIIVGSVFAFVLLNNSTEPQEFKFITGEIKNTRVDLSIKDPKTGEVKLFSSNVQSGENVLMFMKNLQAEESGFTFTFSESEYGTFITGVNGYEANSDNQEFWKLFINNKPAEVGVNDYVLKGGDSLRWEIDHF